MNQKTLSKIVEDHNELKNFEECDFSLLEPNFYDVNKERFFEYKTLHERLSSNYIDYASLKNEQEFHEKAIKVFTRLAYSLFTFITREKNPVIFFDLNSNKSYCGLVENEIHIGLSFLSQANVPRQIKVDSIIATIFHEFYHKRWTITGFANKHNIPIDAYYNNPIIKGYFEPVENILMIIHNILEDRRIEALGALEMPGYTFYFEEKRKYGFFLHDEKIMNSVVPEVGILDYLLIKILLPEKEQKFIGEFNRWRELCIPQLEADPLITKTELNEAISKVDNVQYNLIPRIKEFIETNKDIVYSLDFEDVLNAATQIFNLIPEEVREKITSEKVEYINITEGLGSLNKNEGSRIDLSDEEVDDMLRLMSEELKNIEKVEGSGNGNVNEDEKVKIEKLKQDKRFSEYKICELIKEPLRPINNTILNEARAISKSIFNNLGFLDSKFNRNIEEFELSEGDLDETELYSINFNKDLFEQVEPLEGYSLDFGILIDESASMRGRIKDAQVATLALMLALKENKHINLFVYGHTANVTNRDKAIQIYEYYNSIRNCKDWRTIFSVKPRVNNADGFAIEKFAEFMKESRSKNKVLVVVSDGQPNAEKYEGEDAIAHVREIIDKLESEGITVIQICMNYIENSAAMFKHYIPYENGNFILNLKKILIDKLNQFSETI